MKIEFREHDNAVSDDKICGEFFNNIKIALRDLVNSGQSNVNG